MDKGVKNMKKFITGTVLGLALLTSASSVFATGPENGNFGGSGNAWTNDYGMHYVNNNNPDVRFDWENHRFAVPGMGGMHADENSAVMGWGEGSLVDPHDTMQP